VRKWTCGATEWFRRTLPFFGVIQDGSIQLGTNDQIIPADLPPVLRW
jgi:hypothetical protein